jgi:hypothetical protein
MRTECFLSARYAVPIPFWFGLREEISLLICVHFRDGITLDRRYKI